MNNNNQIENNDAQCCADFCETTFGGCCMEVVNSYRCTQKAFSASGLWQIRRSKREFTPKTNLH